jgi:hypothetical protein
MHADFLKGSPRSVLFSAKLQFILLLLDQIIFNFFGTCAPKFKWPSQRVSYPRHDQRGLKTRCIKANLHRS